MPRATDFLARGNGRASSAARVAAVVVAATGPMAIGALRAVLPYETVDDSATVLAKVAAHPVRESAVLWLIYLAAATLPVGVLIVGRLAIRHRPVLGTVGAVLAWLGFISLFISVTLADYVALSATGRLPAASAAVLLDAVAAQPAVVVASVVFVVGHIVGGLLLAAALWRVVPIWAALALAVSMPLHFVFAVVIPSGALDACAWTLTGVGLAGAAAWREPQREVQP